MTEGKEMSDRIRRASGREVREEEQQEVVEVLTALREDLAAVKEAQATPLEMLQEIHSNAGVSEEEKEGEEGSR